MKPVASFMGECLPVGRVGMPVHPSRQVSPYVESRRALLHSRPTAPDVHEGLGARRDRLSHLGRVASSARWPLGLVW